MVRPGDGGITRKIRAQAATASEPIRLPVPYGAADTCGGPAVFPPKKTVRNRSGVRIIRAPFFVRIMLAWSGRRFKETATAPTLCSTQFRTENRFTLFLELL